MKNKTQVIPGSSQYSSKGQRTNSTAAAAVQASKGAGDTALFYSEHPAPIAVTSSNNNNQS
jgi:hypothetical protein